MNGILAANPFGVPKVVPAQLCAAAVFKMLSAILLGLTGSAAKAEAVPPKSVVVRSVVAESCHVIGRLICALVVPPPDPPAEWFTYPMKKV